MVRGALCGWRRIVDFYQIKQGRVKKPFAGSLLATATIRAIATDPVGTLWVGTQNGVQQFSNGTLRTYGVADGLPDSEVDVLLADKSGRVWIGTPGGLAAMQNGKVTAYTTAKGLPGNQIQTLYQDREDSLWVGTNHGIARIRDGAITPSPETRAGGESDSLNLRRPRRFVVGRHRVGWSCGAEGSEV